jgi:AcrR family transcriptional regulator
LSEDLITTKDRLLDAAEELFTRKSFEEVSVRELAAAAGVNLAAVNYHFQGKDNLYQQVILRRFTCQRDMTLSALECALAEADGRPSLESVIGAMVREYLQGTLGPESGGSFLSIMAREMNGAQSHANEALFREMVAPVFQAFSRALMAARPHLQQEDLNWIIASIVGQIHHFVFRWKKKQSLEKDSMPLLTMLRLFPALGLPVDQYIANVTDHITRFSSAAVQALHPEVE